MTGYETVSSRFGALAFFVIVAAIVVSSLVVCSFVAGFLAHLAWAEIENGWSVLP